MLLLPGRAARLLAAVLRITVGDDGIQVVAVGASRSRSSTAVTKRSTPGPYPVSP
jgi:hypothetical protein